MSRRWQGFTGMAELHRQGPASSSGGPGRGDDALPWGGYASMDGSVGAFTAGGGGTSSKSKSCPSTLQRGRMCSSCTHWVPDPPQDPDPRLCWHPSRLVLVFPPPAPQRGNLSLPGYLRPAVSAVALGPLPCDEEAGLLFGEAPEQLEVRDEVQHIVVASQFGPLGARLHGHGPATPALRQPPANSRTLGTGTGCQWYPGSVGTPCPRAAHPGSQILGSPEMAVG